MKAHYPFVYWKPIMDVSANSEDRDEMPHYASLLQVLHCLLGFKQSSEIEMTASKLFQHLRYK